MVVLQLAVPAGAEVGRLLGRVPVVDDTGTKKRMRRFVCTTLSTLQVEVAPVAQWLNYAGAGLQATSSLLQNSMTGPPANTHR